MSFPTQAPASKPLRAPFSTGAAFNLFVIGLTAFLTVADLFATQALLPVLAAHYHVAPSAMGTAVNATTFGMAISGVMTALFSRRIDRRIGVAASLALLAVPTALLAHAPDLASFAALRVVQGLLMSAAFTLTLAHLGERCTAAASASAFAAYVTGNVASNLVGRLIAASAVTEFGLSGNFYLFSALNLAGAALVWATLSRSKPLAGHETMAVSPLATLAAHLSNPRLRAAFAIGFCILFAFVGAFSYVNFILVRAPLSLNMMHVGLVYFVFAPSILSTPAASAAVARLGAKGALWLGFGAALLGLPLLLAPKLPLVLAGMVLLACGTFFAQAVATGFVSRSAVGDRGAASGLYLAFYFFGGLVGSAALGQAFDRFGWSACVAGIALALLAGAVVSSRIPSSEAAPSAP